MHVSYTFTVNWTSSFALCKYVDLFPNYLVTYIVFRMPASTLAGDRGCESCSRQQFFLKLAD